MLHLFETQEWVESSTTMDTYKQMKCYKCSKWGPALEHERRKTSIGLEKDGPNCRAGKWNMQKMKNDDVIQCNHADIKQYASR